MTNITMPFNWDLITPIPIWLSRDPVQCINMRIIKEVDNASQADLLGYQNYFSAIDAWHFINIKINKKIAYINQITSRIPNMYFSYLEKKMV